MRCPVVIAISALLLVTSCEQSDSANTEGATDATPSTTTVRTTTSTSIASATTVAPTTTTQITTGTTDVVPSAADGRAVPWHAAGTAHADPLDAVREFLEFVDFRGDLSFGDFEGDRQGGQIVVDPNPPGESEWDLSTTVFLVHDEHGHWVVTGASSPGVVVELPYPEDVVAPPLNVHFSHHLFSETVHMDLWLAGVAEPLVSEQRLTTGSGVMSQGTGDAVVEWPEAVTGPAIAVFRSGTRTMTEAVTTVQLELAVEDQVSDMPTPPTVIGPVGDQRQDILYRPGVRLSLYEPTGECLEQGRPTIVTGGPSSNVFVDWFQSNGYLVADVGWRAPGYTGGLDDGALLAFAYSTNDLGVAVRWLRAHADELCVDTDRIAAVGYSFGAITSLSLAYSIGEVAEGSEVVIDELDGSGTHPSQPPPPPPELSSYSDEVGAVVSFAGFAIASTIEAGEPPALLIHGRDDTTIPFALAEQTCAAATNVGITCELFVHDSGHGLADDVPEALTLADEFLRRELAIAAPIDP